jgi:hypothetical protein
MKLQSYSLGKSLLFSLLLVMLSTACANKVNFLTSSVVPAAEGTVKIKQDKNKNYAIDLQVDNLAEPERLSPPKALYVVWIETSQSGVQNIGQLKTSSSSFSKGLSSSLKTVSSHSPNRVFITAEEDASGNYPGMTMVMDTGRITQK